MFTKLTLNISRSVIENAKITAKKKRTSLSRLVENYLKRITDNEEKSFVLSIIENAPENKTKAGTEKKILKKNLLNKYGS